MTERLEAVDDATAEEARDLWDRAEAADGVGAVSEAFALALGAARDGVVHLLRRDDAGILVGYAQVAQAGTPDAVAELVVDPAARRHGHGRALLDAARQEGARSVWAHGDLGPAQALAAAAGLERTRELYRMARPLTDADAQAPDVPPRYVVETFDDRADVAMLQRINAAAFAEHPEQGRLTVADIQERVDAPWFDPHGLFLLVERDGPADADPVGFHWTKVEPGSSTGRAHGSDTSAARVGTGRGPGSDPNAVRSGTGEVYVVGVAPDHRGLGLAGPLTSLGLAHLARRGLAVVELYVDGDNTAARRTYRRLGFEDAAVDVQYTVRP